MQQEGKGDFIAGKGGKGRDIWFGLERRKVGVNDERSPLYENHVSLAHLVHTLTKVSPG